MAKRHHLSEERVQRVVDDLVTHLRGYGSVNALAEELSAVSGQRIYPNRIHGLLAEDVSRTITDVTLGALEAGLAGLDAGNASNAAGYVDLDERIAAAASAVPSGEDLVSTLSASLGVPAAVVRRSLPSRLAEPVSGTAEFSSGAPDWSWQDVAVSRVLDAVSSEPERRVGLIVPTGGGKTRLGLRVILERLARNDQAGKTAIWVTHRRGLARQARRSLQQLLKERGHLPDDAAAIFESRIKFVMIGDLAGTLQELQGEVSIIVVDEAHHAAAPSYEAIFTSEAPALLLTATPVRADNLPIGIDHVAFAITYRELFERNCVIEPVFDPPLDMTGLDWSTSEGLTELADYLLDRTEQDFGKVLVAVSMQDRAERLHEAVVELLDARPGHPLAVEDVAFVHGGRNSYGALDASDALDESAGSPSGILIATASLVGEGYDDPSIDAAVVTYPSTSIAHLMQVAGRALRWAPGKRRAHVVQLRESALQYYFDQRWLYQEISDELRPELVDLEYADVRELSVQVERLLDEANVPDPVRKRISDQLLAVEVGTDVRVMFAGINFYGAVSSFSQLASWNAILVDGDESARFVNIFNDLSLRQEDIREAQQYLGRSLVPDSAPGSIWKSYMDLINAAEYARKEIHGRDYPGRASRPYRVGTHTTWLRYATLRYRPSVPVELQRFLEDAVNRDDVISAYVAEPRAWAVALRVRLPLAGSIAYLLSDSQAVWTRAARGDLLDRLSGTSLADHLAVVHAWRSGLPAVPVAAVVVDHFAQFLPASTWETQALDLARLRLSSTDAPIEAMSPRRE
ncbi:DEAD/DEAH box helicase [Microbacterium sp. CPCC 204701]|uniref:DEAD/DEAH box helicase n=1 Tax=Microbacterium sp. CPCC 204701 TaxID=2493084 RepID=UPI0013E2AE4B|nr:DEAD/DEAH box helicase family protein [Microbacterium sp. CPCC 204701]